MDRIIIHGWSYGEDTVQKMKFSITDFFSKREKSRSFMRVCSLNISKLLVGLIRSFFIKVCFLFVSVSFVKEKINKRNRNENSMTTYCNLTHPILGIYRGESTDIIFRKEISIREVIQNVTLN